MPWTYIGDVLVDANMSENPAFSNTVTDKPVEEGGSISDHAENEPTTLPLECTITGEHGNMSAEEKYEKLLEITQEKEIIEVVGALQVYENMIIEEFSPQKDSKIENGFTCNISLKQIRVVEQETVEVELGVDPETETQAQGEEGGNGGDSETESRDSKEEEADEETMSSLAYSMLHGNDNNDEEEGEE